METYTYGLSSLNFVFLKKCRASNYVFYNSEIAHSNPVSLRIQFHSRNFPRGDVSTTVHVHIISS